MMIINTAKLNEGLNRSFTYDPDSIGETILAQMGGNRFLVMTGARDLVFTDKSLRMALPRNASKANRLEVVYNHGTDSYAMKFYRHSNGRLNHRTGEFISAKDVEVATFEDVYNDQLQDIFTRVTGMYTRF